MPQKAFSKIVRNPKNAKQEKEPRKPAKTPQDWAEQEAAELPPMKPAQDIINHAVGKDFYLAPHMRDGFRFKTGQPFSVSRFYPGKPALIIDKPETEKEMKLKKEFFATSDLAYVAIAPFEAIAPEELRERIEDELKLKAKKAKAA